MSLARKRKKHCLTIQSTSLVQKPDDTFRVTSAKRNNDGFVFTTFETRKRKSFKSIGCFEREREGRREGGKKREMCTIPWHESIEPMAREGNRCFKSEFRSETWAASLMTTIA
jgi:hypothetical protein